MSIKTQNRHVTPARDVCPGAFEFRPLNNYIAPHEGIYVIPARNEAQNLACFLPRLLEITGDAECHRRLF